MATANARAARERKQKLFVAVGGLLLVGLLAIQLPKLMGGSESSAATDTETTTTIAGETVPATPGGVPTPVGLSDTDRPLPLAPGQLRSFTTFARKDPFVQQIASPAEAGRGTASQGGEGSTGTAGDGGTDTSQTPTKSFATGGSAAAAVTVLSVNGARQALEPGTAFPAADPVFVLVAELPNAKSVVIGVAGGAYSSGARTTRLQVGKPLVLVNTTTGARYRLVLVAVGNEGTSAAEGPQQESPSSPTSP